MTTGSRSNSIILTGLTLIALTACSTQQVKQEVATPPEPKEAPAITNEALPPSGTNPPLTLMKGDKKLNLVRILDGGACKNDLQGAKGTFLLYANLGDIERIKRKKGPKIFSDFESKIQTLSTDALQQAINVTNLAKDPFALGEDEAQEKLAGQLSNNFRNAVSAPADAFEKETTLTIVINAFPPSLIFYQTGCEATQIEESPNAENN